MADVTAATASNRSITRTKRERVEISDSDDAAATDTSSHARPSKHPKISGDSGAKTARETATKSKSSDLTPAMKVQRADEYIRTQRWMKIIEASPSITTSKRWSGALQQARHYLWLDTVVPHLVPNPEKCERAEPQKDVMDYMLERMTKEQLHEFCEYLGRAVAGGVSLPSPAAASSSVLLRAKGATQRATTALSPTTAKTVNATLAPVDGSDEFERSLIARPASALRQIYHLLVRRIKAASSASAANATTSAAAIATTSAAAAIATTSAAAAIATSAGATIAAQTDADDVHLARLTPRQMLDIARCIESVPGVLTQYEVLPPVGQAHHNLSKDRVTTPGRARTQARLAGLQILAYVTRQEVFVEPVSKEDKDSGDDADVALRVRKGHGYRLSNDLHIWFAEATEPSHHDGYHPQEIQRGFWMGGDAGFTPESIVGRTIVGTARPANLKRVVEAGGDLYGNAERGFGLRLDDGGREIIGEYDEGLGVVLVECAFCGRPSCYGGVGCPQRPRTLDLWGSRRIVSGPSAASAPSAPAAAASTATAAAAASSAASSVVAPGATNVVLDLYNNPLAEVIEAPAQLEEMIAHNVQITRTYRIAKWQKGKRTMQTDDRARVLFDGFYVPGSVICVKYKNRGWLMADVISDPSGRRGKTFVYYRLRHNGSIDHFRCSSSYMKKVCTCKRTGTCGSCKTSPQWWKALDQKKTAASPLTPPATASSASATTAAPPATASSASATTATAAAPDKRT